MLHTMELTRGIAKEEFEIFKDYVDKHRNEVTFQTRNGSKLPVLYLETFKEHGLRFCVPYETYDNTGWNGVQMYAEVNFSKLAGFDNPVQLAAQADLPTIHQNFFCLTENAPFLSYFAEQLDFWKVHRVDYAVNCHTPEVDTYLKLLKHGDRVNRRESNTWNACYNPEYRNFYHLVRNSDGKLYYTFNFYDKEAERIDRNKGSEEVDAAKDIMRIEMQCHASKVRDLCSKFKISNVPSSFFNYDICRYVLLDLGVNQIVKDAPFYRRSALIKWITKHTKQERRTRLLQIVDEVNENGGSIYKAKQDKAKFAEDLKVMMNGGRNIITLPDRAELPTLKYSTVGCLASVQTLVRAAIEAETGKIPVISEC